MDTASQKAVEGIAGRVDPDLLVAANAVAADVRVGASQDSPGSQAQEAAEDGTEATGSKGQRKGGSRKRKAAAGKGGGEATTGAEDTNEQGGEGGEGGAQQPARKRGRSGKRAGTQDAAAADAAHAMDVGQPQKQTLDIVAQDTAEDGPGGDEDGAAVAARPTKESGKGRGRAKSKQGKTNA